MNYDNSRHDNDAFAEPAIFSAIITPHRSLGSAGFLVFMLVVSGISFASGMLFLMIGAWPVFGFFGLDVLLIYWAFAPIFAPRAPMRR